MATRPTLKVSKTDAAKRQIETAIRLWFYSGDPVSIHTLATAAHRILHDLGRKRGLASVLRQWPGVRPEHKKELRSLFTRYENFFKHADKDPEALLDFNPEATEVFIFDAVLIYRSLTQEVSPILETFKAWMLVHKPHLMDERSKQEFTERFGGSWNAHFTCKSKAEFFTEHLSGLMRLGIA